MLKVGFYDGDLVLIVKLRRIFLILIPADYPLEKKDNNQGPSFAGCYQTPIVIKWDCLVVPPPIPRLPCQVRQIPPTVRPVLWACLQIWMLFNWSNAYLYLHQGFTSPIPIKANFYCNPNSFPRVWDKWGCIHEICYMIMLL